MYTGSCHCGKLTIAARLKTLEDDEDSGMIECNCSICERVSHAQDPPLPLFFHLFYVSLYGSNIWGAQNAYLWVYPQTDQVVLAGREEDIARYRFNHEMLAKPFCRTCGVSMSNPVNAQTTPDEAATRMPDADAARQDGVRTYMAYHAKMHPVNVRVLHGVDLDRLHVKRLDGGKRILPPYVNP